MEQVLWLTWLLFGGVPQVFGNPDAKRLYDDLLSNYNRLIRPVGNNSDRLTVKMGLRLSQLIDVVILLACAIPKPLAECAIILVAVTFALIIRASRQTCCSNSGRLFGSILIHVDASSFTVMKSYLPTHKTLSTHKLMMPFVYNIN